MNRNNQRVCLMASRNLLMVVGLSAGLATGLCVGVGCKNQPVRNNKTVDVNEPVNTGLNHARNGEGLLLPEQGDLVGDGDEAFGSVSDQIEETARQLSVYFANMEIDGVEEVDPSTRVRVELPEQGDDAEVSENAQGHELVENEPISDDDDGFRVSLLGGAGDELEEQVSEAGENESPVVSKAVDPLVRKEELARELAAILTSMAASSDDPGSAALALAGLELLLPTDTDSLVDEGVLSDGELASLDAMRSVLRSMSSEGSIASPSEVAAGLGEIQTQLNAWSGMAVAKAALCTRVDGFGRYEIFSSYRFVAGQAQPAIVYVELERFGQREFVGTDGQARYETKLSQRLELYHVADDLNTWNRAAETVTDVTRNHLRDYYLINQITIPANLGVGRYHLKVVMRDLIGEKVAESIIPIEIVSR